MYQCPNSRATLHNNVLVCCCFIVNHSIYWATLTHMINMRVDLKSLFSIQLRSKGHR